MLARTIYHVMCTNPLLLLKLLLEIALTTLSSDMHTPVSTVSNCTNKSVPSCALNSFS